MTRTKPSRVRQPLAVVADLDKINRDATTDGVATGLSRALVALEVYDYEPFERKGMELAARIVRSLLEATVD